MTAKKVNAALKLISQPDFGSRIDFREYDRFKQMDKTLK